MKRITKTAEQKFHERLNELTILDTLRYGDKTYHLCESPTGNMCLMVADAIDNTYRELTYNVSTIEQLYSREIFLTYLVDNHQHADYPLNELFEWYKSGFKKAGVVNYEDLYMSCTENAQRTFNDTYSERALTAYEKLAMECDKYGIVHHPTYYTSGKEVGDEIIVAHVNANQGTYVIKHFPSWDKLRLIPIFVEKLTKYSRANFNEELNSLVIRWLCNLGGCPLVPSDLFWISEVNDGIATSIQEFTDDEQEEPEQDERPTIWVVISESCWDFKSSTKIKLFKDKQDGLDYFQQIVNNFKKTQDDWND